MTDAARPTPDRIEWLDALRGWAVLGVVMVHAGLVVHTTGVTEKISDAGQYGVQLFFVVSALTISLTYNAHIAQFGTTISSQLAWLTKRFFRIAPLYYFAAVFYPIEQYAIHVVSHHRYGSVVSLGDIFVNFVFLHTWIASANNTVVPGGWSIGVEMFFYLLVPLIWMLKPTARRVLILGISAIAFLSLTLLASLISTRSVYVEDNTFLYYWFPTQAPVIILGLIFYLVGLKAARKISAPGLTAACLAGFLVCFAAAIYLGTGVEIAPVLAPTLAGVSFLFLIASLHGRVMSVIANNAVVNLGKISYSVYIFHFVVLDAIRVLLQLAHFHDSGPLALATVFLLALAVTCIIAVVSKRLIEDPAINYGHRLSRRMIGSGDSTGTKRLIV